MADPIPTDPIIPIPVAPKPGVRTTEFWISAIVALVGAMMTIGVFKPGTPYDKMLGVIAMTLSAMGYTAGRSIVKAVALKMVVGLSLVMAVPGCAWFNPAATDQQKLDAGKQTYTNANNIITLAITFGYIAKNDQALKDAIFQASAMIRDDFAKAQEYINAGNHITFQFWFDSAMNGLATFLQYQADAERKIKLSNPTTRPALPQKVEADYGGPIDRSGSRRFDSRYSGSYRGQATRRYAYG